MGSNYLIKFLEEKEVPTITKKRHTYLTYYGLEQQDTYVLKEGVIKTSIILNIPWWRSHPIHENRATKSIWTEPCNPLLRATKSTKRATSA